MFICPHCHEEIDHVFVISQCTQRADINQEGIITSYDAVDEVGDTEVICCWRCDGDLTEVVGE